MPTNIINAADLNIRMAISDKISLMHHVDNILDLCTSTRTVVLHTAPGDIKKQTKNYWIFDLGQ